MAYVAVIDDDEDMATAIATILRDSGHDVRIELDIKNAEKVLEERRPDLVVLDVMFPGNNSAGLTFARRMQLNNEKLKGIPVLMLTAINKEYPLGFSSRDIDEQWLPVADFVDKPIDPAVLRQKVSALLRKGETDGGGAAGKSNG